MDQEIGSLRKLCQRRMKGRIARKHDDAGWHFDTECKAVGKRRMRHAQRCHDEALFIEHRPFIDFRHRHQIGQNRPSLIGNAGGDINLQ